MKTGNISKIILLSALFFSSTVWAATNPITLDGPSFPALMGVGYSQNFTYTVHSNQPFSMPYSISGYSGPVTLSNNNCGSSLSAQTTCHFDVTITATMNELANGIHQTIHLDYPGGVGALKSPININVTTPALTLSSPNPAISSRMVDGDTQTVTYTIQNTGNVPTAPISITGMSAPLTLTSGQDHCSGQALPINASCTFAVTIAPTENGQINQMLTVSYGGRSSVTSTI